MLFRSWFHWLRTTRHRNKLFSNNKKSPFMKIHKQGITFVLLLLVFTSCSRKPSLQWIPFSWEGDTISGIYIEKAFLNVPVKIENLPYEFTMQFDLGAYNSVFYGNTFAPYLKEAPSLMNKKDSTGMYKNVNQIGRASCRERV